MRVALIQMGICENDPDKNTEHGLDLLEEAAQQSDLVVMPELWTTGYSLGRLRHDVLTTKGPVMLKIRLLARKYACSIIPGSLPLKREEGIFNTAPAINKEGTVVNLYDKLHLFSPFHEGKYFQAGQNRDTFLLDTVRIGSTICYDLRFPELYRYLALQGAQIVTLAAEWPEERGAAWELLAQARALENGIFVIAVNCVGSFNDVKFYGHSQIIAPTGQVLLAGSDQEEILYADLDLNQVAQARSTFNVMQDVRRDLWFA